MICGSSGSGKSTLIGRINSLENYQSGTIRIEGVEVNERERTLSASRGRIGMVFQHFICFRISPCSRTAISVHMSKKIITWRGGNDASQRWVASVNFGNEIALRAGQLLYEQDRLHDFFYYIREGAILATVYGQEGDILTVEIMGPGTLFGEAAALSSVPRQVTTEAVSDSELIRYSRTQTLEVLQRRPELSLLLFQVVAQKQAALLEKVFVSSRSTHEGSLLALFQRFIDVGQFKLELNHNQIGDIIGASRVTVSRQLQRLRNAGLIETSRSCVTIVDPEGLIERARASTN